MVIQIPEFEASNPLRLRLNSEPLTQSKSEPSTLNPKPAILSIQPCDCQAGVGVMFACSAAAGPQRWVSVWRVRFKLYGSVPGDKGEV